MNTAFQRYAITDHLQISSAEGNRARIDVAATWQACLVQQARWLAAEGVEYLQLRVKDLGAGDIASLARSLLHVLHGSRTRLLLNARADIAVATGAPGVHLTSSPDELTPQQVRALYAAAKLPAPELTLSCHTVEEVMRRSLEPVTAILFAPVFEKVLLPAPGMGALRVEGTGLAQLREACRAAAPIPVFALGGVTDADIPACLEAGAQGVAGIRLFGHPLHLDLAGSN